MIKTKKILKDKNNKKITMKINKIRSKQLLIRKNKKRIRKSKMMKNQTQKKKNKLKNKILSQFKQAKMIKI